MIHLEIISDFFSDIFNFSSDLISKFEFLLSYGAILYFKEHELFSNLKTSKTILSCLKIYTEPRSNKTLLYLKTLFN